MTHFSLHMRFPITLSVLLLGGLAASGCKASNPELPGIEDRAMGTKFSKDTEQLEADLGKPQAAFATVSAPAPGPASDPDPVVATVGDEVVRVSELLSTWMLVDSQGLRDMLGKLVTGKMVKAEAERFAITVAPENLAREYTQSVDELRKQVQADQPGKSLDEWIAGGLGLDPARFRRGLRDDVENRMLSERVVRHFILTQANVDLAVIVVATEADAQSAMAKVKGGEPFGRVATEMSIDSTGKFGGRIAPVVRNESALSRLAFGTPEGELGGPLEEAGRWMLTQTLAVNEPLEGTWTQISAQVEASLGERAMAEPEYWLWKQAANDRAQADFAPFFELIGEPKGAQSL
jgi:hypothetical protein